LSELYSWQFLENVIKIFVWIQAIGFGTFDYAVNSSTSCSSFRTSTEQPIFSFMFLST
jgi:hypothetical protein